MVAQNTAETDEQIIDLTELIEKGEVPASDPSEQTRAHAAAEAAAEKEELQEHLRDLNDGAVKADAEIDDLLAIGEADIFLRPGLPRSVLRDLRRGRWAIRNHIDLHGLNRHEAHEEVSRFLAESVREGKRCVRIVRTATGADTAAACAALEQCNYSAKTAILMILRGIDAPAAEARLAQTQGRIAEALRIN